MSARALGPASLIVGGLTLVGFLIRLAAFDQSLFGDELSTYWILDGHSLGEVLSSVRSNDEITPPLYFVLGWLSLQVGPDPEWVRLPSLLAGTATIPLVYLLGLRTVGRRAATIAAALIALAPFMVYYSVEARSYAVMIALLTASTLCLLLSLDRGGVGWWLAYAGCSCGALLSHYTSVFPLAAQFAWAAWVHREALRELLLANLAVVVGFAPWIPGFVADNNSPTTSILSALQPFTPGAVRSAIEHWAVGYPYLRLSVVPGEVGLALICAGIAVAVIAVAIRLVRSRQPIAETLRRIPPPVYLVVALALATPVGEAIFSAVGTNLLGARNLNASWPGLALATAALLAAAGPIAAPACAALVVGGFAVGAATTLRSDAARPDFAGAAALIDSRAAPRDVVVDAAALTPVPLTPLDVYLPQTRPEFRLGLPRSDRPFAVGDPVPPPARQIRRSFRLAGGGAIFLVTALPGGGAETGATVREEEVRAERKRFAAMLLRELPAGFEVVRRRSFDGLVPVGVYEIEDRRSAAG